MKLAIAQINTMVGDLEGNIRRILDAAETARHTDLIVFPEMTVPGYPPRDLLYDSSFVDAVELATQDLARRAKGLPPMLVGSFQRSGRKLFEHPALHNVAYLVQDGSLHTAQVKQLLPVYDVFYEPRWFVPGEHTLPPVEIAGKRIGVLVCEDMWDEEYPIHPGVDLAAMGAEMLVCMSASPYRKGGHAGRVHHAARQDLPLVFVNLVGGNDELIFDGHGFVTGGVELKSFEEEVRMVTMDDAPPAADASRSTVLEQELFAALTLGLRDFARKNGLSHAFLGLSGGIDSSVAAALMVEALGASNVTGVAIPSRFTDPRSTQAAKELAQTLGMHFETVELEPMHIAAESALGAERSAGVSGENIQARLRMVVLMSFVNQRGGFLVNTSNKTELTLGYGTLYGDLAGTISPLGDLTKPEVYALGRWLNVRGGGAVIPEFVMTRPPSAELRAGQVDPFDYALVAPEAEQLVQAGRSNARMRASEHKRWGMGLVLKVSGRSFGRGRLVPVTRK